ncbi:type II toxin-antitoxin system PemK/MazF family toxin [Cellulomonas dongxiuzhuiae]|uniref:Type II toxin-antitoxin system PemK/MazF family toxin n=1 Tax=Cellulomonas dongxiuzhuiae TaxID=2819979 RepID=A0ABX8GLH9_9CELL|nr:type II toxin-antitoxin system PemK/MazF family toxin [Cellulomonas dongxiuzhuiae]QWC17018.1 type II toxin-antitoxin system PemK/MazF family toxin [Cellulomonas dongxiuzhuiae]
MPLAPQDLADALARPEVLGLVALLLLVALVARRRRRVAAPRTRAGRPRVGDVWFADVPFDDGPGSKDRPVLVLRVDGRTWEVARFTSQDRSARRDHVRLPPGFPGLTRASWIDLRPRTLPLSAARRRTGHAGEALVAWYRDASDDRGPS